MGEASSDIQSQLEQVKESIESINGMSSFSGKTAEEMKSYFEEMHLTIIKSFRGLFGDLEADLKQHMQDFQTKVDASESAKIESNYLKEVQEDIKEVYEDLESQEDIIAETIKEVSDITTADVPKFSEVTDAKDEAVEKTEEVEEYLESFNGTSEEIDVESILSQIESVMEKPKPAKAPHAFWTLKELPVSKILRNCRIIMRIRRRGS